MYKKNFLTKFIKSKQRESDHNLTYEQKLVKLHTNIPERDYLYKPEVHLNNKYPIKGVMQEKEKINQQATDKHKMNPISSHLCLLLQEKLNGNVINEAITGSLTSKDHITCFYTDVKRETKKISDMSYESQFKMRFSFETKPFIPKPEDYTVHEEATKRLAQIKSPENLNTHEKENLEGAEKTSIRRGIELWRGFDAILTEYEKKVKKDQLYYKKHNIKPKHTRRPPEKENNDDIPYEQN